MVQILIALVIQLQNSQILTIISKKIHVCTTMTSGSFSSCTKDFDMVSSMLIPNNLPPKSKCCLPSGLCSNSSTSQEKFPQVQQEDLPQLCL